jgi:hypothetical protein
MLFIAILIVGFALKELLRIVFPRHAKWSK